MPAVRKLANSVRLALPRITAPAFLSCATSGASADGRERASATEPAAVPVTEAATVEASGWRGVSDMPGPAGDVRRRLTRLRLWPLPTLLNARSRVATSLRRDLPVRRPVLPWPPARPGGAAPHLDQR